MTTRFGNSKGTGRTIVDAAGWRAAAQEMAAGGKDLFGLWGDDGAVHMAVWDPARETLDIMTYLCADGTFPSVSAIHAPADRLERTIVDFYGYKPQNPLDTRPWLDHGNWGLHQPLGQVLPPAPQPEYKFLPVEGESLHEIPVGPVHAGIIEPGHFRFTANGEAVVRLEERLGWVHKGTEVLLRGADIARGAVLAGRNSGDASVAYQWAYAQAIEAALGASVPDRAQYLRALMAEMERIANHLGDIGAICNDASFSMMFAHCGVLREHVARAALACFGNRQMRDAVVPGGVARDLTAENAAILRNLVITVREKFQDLVQLYDNTASLQDRTVTTGILKPEYARQYAAGGHVGRAAGRAFDSRRMMPYGPYGKLEFKTALREAGDVDARVWVRIIEVNESLAIIDQILERMPDGAFVAQLPAVQGVVEGCGIAESFRGEVMVWLRLGADGCIERCHLRDPSWFQWPLLEAVIEGNIVADFPLCNKSFNCSYSGHDL